MSLQTQDPYRQIRKAASFNKSVRRLMQITLSAFFDDFDDASGIDAGESSGHGFNSGGFVGVADGEASATVVSISAMSNYTVTKVEVVAAFTGSPTFDVSADDGASWVEGVGLETEVAIPVASRGRTVRLRANLAPADTLDFWSIHY